jgi:hypothetical protein
MRAMAEEDSIPTVTCSDATDIGNLDTSLHSATATATDQSNWKWSSWAAAGVHAKLPDHILRTGSPKKCPYPWQHSSPLAVNRTKQGVKGHILVENHSLTKTLQRRTVKSSLPQMVKDFIVVTKKVVNWRFKEESLLKNVSKWKTISTNCGF